MCVYMCNCTCACTCICVPVCNSCVLYCYSGHPVKVPLPGPAQQIACGESHTAVLLSTGEVYTFGKHQEGQLGRQPVGLDNDSWFTVPGLMEIPSEGCRAKWITASGNQTFVAIDESLIAEKSLSRCRVFANSQCIGGCGLFLWQ